jgi:hypothetical protein
MGSLREDVSAGLNRGEFRDRLLRYCLDWRRHRSPYALANAVRYASRAGAHNDLYEVLSDEEFRSLRRALSGANALRADLQAGLAHFSSEQPDVLRFIHVLFLEQARSTDADGLARHRGHCIEFADFLQLDTAPADRLDRGLHRGLGKFFPAIHDEAEEAGYERGGRAEIHLAGYELGDWRCSCGRHTGQDDRYRFRCRCGKVSGVGTLVPEAVTCASCATAPEYLRCSACGTRVTHDLLWRLRAGNVHPSELRLPLKLDLLIHAEGRPERRQQLLLMHLPLMLGLREHAGEITFDLPNLFWLRVLVDDYEPPGDSGQLVSMIDAPRYDGRDQLCELLEAAFRRTLLGREGSYRSFAKRLCNHLRVRWGPSGNLVGALTRGFERRLRFAVLKPDRRSTDLVRFADLSYDCVVASSPGLRGRMAIANRRLTVPGALCAPYLKNVTAVVRNIDVLRSWTLCADPPDASDEQRKALGGDGLAVPGRLVMPKDVLVGMTAAVPEEELTPEERLLRAIFGEKAPVRDRDVSLRLDGNRPGRVIAERIVVETGFDDSPIQELPGRSFGLTDELGWTETRRITVTLAIDQPMETGDTIVGEDGASVVVCGISSGPALASAAESTDEPDLVVAAGHPWVSAQGVSTVRVRLKDTALAGLEAIARATGRYSVRFLQPMHGEYADGYAQVLRAPQFQWLFSRELWQLARELFGPRCDFADSRVPFYEALAEGNRSLTGFSTAGHLIPASAQVHEWHQLLLSAGIVATYHADRLTFVGARDCDVRSASSGEVRKPETRNYQTGLPEPGGLFCEKIFGPERNWRCRCGKYGRRKHAGQRCERCGVDVTHSAVRRIRIGHLELAAPVIHPWYTNALPGWLDLAPETVRQIVDYERWLVVDSNDPDLPAGTLLSDHEWAMIRYDHPESDVRAALGAEAIESLLQHLPRSTGMAFDGVVMRRLPILPPELRPMIRLESGSFATSDLNDLYRRIVVRNNRLSRLMDLDTPEPIINHERRELQRSVDHLLDNERSEHPISSPDRRVLVSVASALTSRVMRGTTAREGFLFRPVDFSASTRMIVGEVPDVDTVQLPVRLARQLFEPLLRGRHRARRAASGGTAGVEPRGAREPAHAAEDDYADERRCCVVAWWARLGAAVPSSDGEDEFGEGLRDPMPRVDIKAEFVMTAVEVLDEGVSRADYSR